MTIATNLGFPRIGHRRELKFALERFWSGELDEAGLEAEAAALRTRHWKLQVGRGISHVPSGDFSLYDHVLDTACMLGAIPPGYGWSDGPVSLASYFALARGSRGTAAEQAAGIAAGLPALEMTKWFDTNYHYLVPRLTRRAALHAHRQPAAGAVPEAMALAIRTRPVLLGPVSFLMLAKTEDGSDPLDLLPGAAAGLCRSSCGNWPRPVRPGCRWTSRSWRSTCRRRRRLALARAYDTLAPGSGARNPARQLFRSTRRQSHHRRRAAGGRPASRPGARRRGTGCRSGRRAGGALAVARRGRRAQCLAHRPARGARACCSASPPRRGTRRLMVAPSCSLLHVPVDLAQETGLDPRGEGMARLRRAEAGRGGDAGARPGRGRRRRSPRNSRQATPPCGPAEPARACIGRMSRPGWPRVTPAMERRASPYPAAPRGPAGPARICRCSRPPRSAPSRRRRRCASARAALGARRAAPRPRTSEPSKAGSTTPSAGRRRSGSTCWCTASSSATTW